MFNLYKYLKLIDEYSEEKVKSKIFCSWYGDTIKILLVAIFIDAFFFPILTRYSYNYYLIFYFFIILGMFYYLVTRKAGLGLTENRLVYIRFKRLGMEIKKIEEIPFTKIRSINVRSFIGIYFVYFSYISSSGRLEKVRVYFAKRYWGFNSTDIMENRKMIVEKLMKMQKVLDRGDF